jgi:hypothetical protein
VKFKFQRLNPSFFYLFPRKENHDLKKKESDSLTRQDLISTGSSRKTVLKRQYYDGHQPG